MLFSVIIPVYNVEKYLRQCIESVLSQTYDDYELILVDDGSQDNSPIICEYYAKADDRVKVIHTINSGAAAARNLGIKASRGEYICFLDADDFWNNNSVLSDIAITIENKRPDIVRIGTKNIRENDNQIISDPIFNWEKYQNIQKDKYIYEQVADGSLKIAAFACSVKRDFLLNNALLFTEGMRVEDLEWAIRCYACKPTWGFLKENGYVSRRGREGSVTNTIGTLHLLDYLKIIKKSIEIVEQLDENYRYPLLSYLMYHVTILISLLHNNRTIDENYRNSMRTQLREICKRYYKNYTLNRKVKYLSKLYCVLGYSGLEYFLGLFLRLRGR